jgi:hypothetical protein
MRDKDRGGKYNPGHGPIKPKTARERTRGILRRAGFSGDGAAL